MHVVRFAVMVAIVLAALAAGISLGIGMYYYFYHVPGFARPPASETTSTIRRALD
ncbi:hypothetical protein [Hyphomicrobium sp.]|uniref:hypothetical protein n=1 Tax=Hyphomicrobium sp. TaxID=82 RepID=UPI001DC03ED4|nr:hypothetical protein [Hyphomicrobium sp.]MBY0558957.1 hypothetical protein [Hyphomicrobium sp.]